MKQMKKGVVILTLVVALCATMLVACKEADNELDTSGYTFNHRITRDNLKANGFENIEFFDVDSSATFFADYMGTDVNGFDGTLMMAQKDIPEDEQEYIAGEDGYACKELVMVVYCCCEGDAKAMLADFTNTSEVDYVAKLEAALELNPSKTVYGVVGSTFYIGTKSALQATQEVLESAE